MDHSNLSNGSSEFHVWAKERRTHAQELRKAALDFAGTLFANGNLLPYVEILSRLHSYNFYNLLLVLREFPEATCLASFQEWKKQTGDPSRQILRKEYKGKGIELIAPFTEPPRNKKRALYWFGIKQFDVSQTNIAQTFGQSIYELEPRNKTYLVVALCKVLSREYHCIVSNPPAKPYPSDSVPPGFRDGDVLYCFSEAPTEDRIIWLTQNLIDLSKPEILVGYPYKALFSSLLQSCLMRIWNVSEYYYLYQDKSLVQSVPKSLQPTFLNQLQVQTRHFEELIHCAYLEQIKSREEVLPDTVSLFQNEPSNLVSIDEE